MDLGLKGKTAVVTGGGSNIGRAIFLTFAKEGANLVNAELDEKQGLKVVGEANALRAGGRAIEIKTDVTNPDSVKAMVEKGVKEFGQIDILVNVVGWTIDKLFIEKSRAEWEKEVNLNLWSVINCCRAVADHMIGRKYGKIVSIGSDAGRMGEYREAVYGGTKGAVIALSKALAREWGRYSININVVCPGATIPQSLEHVGELSMTKDPNAPYKDIVQKDIPDEIKAQMLKAYPLRRLATAQEIANAVVFLASDAASFITGQTLSVSGGYTMM